jgi:hypothetical protein
MSTPGIGPIAMVSDDLARSEHARRERAWSPAVRWQVIQETIAWAAAQATVHRNTPAACIADERRKQALGPRVSPGTGSVAKVSPGGGITVS